MKKWSIYGICLVLLLMLGACRRKDDTESGVPADGTGHKLGVGVVSTMDMMGEDSTTVKATVAAVLLDKDGVIRQCRLDETTFDARLQNGVLQDMLDMASKWELGDEYELTKDELGESQTTRSWKEQVEAFCDYVKGMTPDEVSAIAATDGRSSEIEGCHLVITDFIQAVHKAGKEAKAASAADSDTLKLAVTTAKNDESTDNTPQYDIEIAAVTVDKDGRITGCFTDTLQAKMTVEEGIFSMVSGDIATKRQMGDAYGMKEASSIKKEWYQQADAFDAYAIGKTADELRKVNTDSEGKVDGISGCTIKVTGMLKNTVKAAEQTDEDTAGTGQNTSGNTSGSTNGTGGTAGSNTSGTDGNATGKGVTTGTRSGGTLGEDMGSTVSDTVSDITSDISDITH